jgi:hypothetical protein
MAFSTAIGILLREDRDDPLAKLITDLVELREERGLAIVESEMRALADAVEQALKPWHDQHPVVQVINNTFAANNPDFPTEDNFVKVATNPDGSTRIDVYRRYWDYTHATLTVKDDEITLSYLKWWSPKPGTFYLQNQVIIPNDQVKVLVEYIYGEHIDRIEKQFGVVLRDLHPSPT